MARGTQRGKTTTIRARGLRIVGVFAAALAVAVPMVLSSGDGTAGGAITTPPFELVDAGSLTLRTGTTNNVVRRAPDDSILSTQTITAASSCAVTTTPTLLRMVPTKGTLGINSGTIGDRTKGSGTDCGLIEAGGALTITLGSQIPNLEMRSFAFDIESRKNLRLVLTASLGGATTATYQLRTGTSVVPGQGSTTPGSDIFNCNVGSSSDPNAGDRDNCRFTGSALADKLVLTAVVGEMGLSGGASGGATQPSVIELTDIDGLLDCESQPNNGDFDLTEGGNGTPEVGIIRKDNLDPDEPCELIPVDLRSSVDNGVPQLEFLKDLTNQVSAAFTLDVTWPFEAAQNPPPPTQFEFVDGEPFEMDLCVGTPVYDPPTDDYDPTTDTFEGIGELLDPDPSNDGVVPDQAASLPGKQYACYYYQETRLPENGTVELFQQIYITGDFRGYR